MTRDIQNLRIFSIQSRLKANEKGLHLFVKYPVFGVGYNHIRDVKGIEEKTASNHANSGYPSSFMTVLVSMGTIGLLSLLYLFFLLWKKGSIEQKTLLTILMTASLFENILFIPFVFILFALCWCLFNIYRFPPPRE